MKSSLSFIISTKSSLFPVLIKYRFVFIQPQRLRFMFMYSRYLKQLSSTSSSENDKNTKDCCRTMTEEITQNCFHKKMYLCIWMECDTANFSLTGCTLYLPSHWHCAHIHAFKIPRMTDLEVTRWGVIQGYQSSVLNWSEPFSLEPIIFQLTELSMWKLSSGSTCFIVCHVSMLFRIVIALFLFKSTASVVSHNDLYICWIEKSQPNSLQNFLIICN